MQAKKGQIITSVLGERKNMTAHVWGVVNVGYRDV